MPRRGRTRTRRAGCSCGPAIVLADGRVGLDWRTHPVERRPGPCRICGRPAWLRDCSGARCHKTCAEAEATRDLALAAGQYGRR